MATMPLERDPGSCWYRKRAFTNRSTYGRPRPTAGTAAKSLPTLRLRQVNPALQTN